ncbi:nucleic acid-binding protein [Aspergillus venezuelensis]
MSAFTSSSLRSFARAATPMRTFSTSSARSAARLNVVGRLGATPELRTSQSGNEYIRYNVASRDSTREKTTSWFQVQAYVAPAQQEFLLGLQKGSIVSVEAEATYKKSEDGRFNLLVIQRQLEVLARGRPTEENTAAAEETQQ